MRDRDPLPLQVGEGVVGRVLPDHEGRPVAVAEVDDLHRDALPVQDHRERGQDERGLQGPGRHVLGDRREVRVALRLEDRALLRVRRHPTGDGTGEMSRHGEVADREVAARGGSGADPPAAVQSDVGHRQRREDDRKPRPHPEYAPHGGGG